MKYALAKFRVDLLANGSFIVYADHESLRTPVNSPHLSQRIVRWLYFFAEHKFSVAYKPGRLTFVTDALSRRPDFYPATHSNSKINPTVATLAARLPSSKLLDDVRKAFADNKDLLRLMDYLFDPFFK